VGFAPSRGSGITRRAWLGGTLGAAGVPPLGAGPAREADAAARDARGALDARLRLSLNESPYGPSPRVVEALKGELQGLARYTTADEAGALIRQIAAFEAVSEEHVLLGEILEALGLQLGLRGGPGGEFLFSQPGYTALVDAARPVGGVAVPLPLDLRQQNDLPAFLARVGPRTRAVFLVNPHNPSGTVSPAAELKAAVGALARKTLVVVDEAYLDYLDDFAERTLVEAVRGGQNVIVFRTFSKLHGLAALPLGYAVGPAGLLESLRKSGLGNPRALNRLAVRAAAVSLGDPGYGRRVRAEVGQERARVQAALDSWKVRHSDARASFVFFQSARGQAEVAGALSAEGIEIGRAFPPLLDWTRISLGLPEDNRRVLAALHPLLT
jgi:histidinol-phosphate aminotransferase